MPFCFRDPSILKLASSSLPCITARCLKQQMSAYRGAVPVPFQCVTRNAPLSVRTQWSDAAVSPFPLPHSSTPLFTDHDQFGAQEEKESTTKSVDDFPVRNIYVGGIPFFSDTAMVQCRLAPVLFKKGLSNNVFAERNGFVYFQFWPRAADGEEMKFDKSKKFVLTVRGIDIGTILEIDANKVESSISIPVTSGHLEILPGASVNTIRLKGIPKLTCEGGPGFLEVEISSARFKTLQTLLFHASPSLFGWQLLMDPRLLPLFLEPAVSETGETRQQATGSFFDA